jgi:hypothetical protein
MSETQINADETDQFWKDHALLRGALVKPDNHAA